MFSEAHKKAVTLPEKMLCAFYELYITKMIAIQVGDKDSFNSCNEKILELLREEFEAETPAVVFHTVGKEVYKVALNSLGSKNRKQKEELFENAEALFVTAVAKNYPHSFYYLGEINEMGDIRRADLKKAVDLYKQAALHRSPRALFKLAQLYSSLQAAPRRA
jgi:TPR repeat protein